MVRRCKSSLAFSIDSLREQVNEELRTVEIGSKMLQDLTSISLNQVDHVLPEIVLCASLDWPPSLLTTFEI